MDQAHDRRQFLRSAVAVGAVAVATPAVLIGCSSDSDSDSGVGGAESPEVPRPPDSQAALQALKDGNVRFVNGESIHPNLGEELRNRTAEGQQPFAAILACADSRAAPELIFDQGIGDLFVVRVAGNIVDPAGAASLAYAVEVLGVEVIVVLGHEKCGAVHAAIEVSHGEEVPAEFTVLTEPMAPAIAAAEAQGGDEEAVLANAVAENALLGVQNLPTASPLIADAVATDALPIVAATYDLYTSEVTFLS